MMQDDGFDAAKDYVRVGVKSGGCSGLSYELKFDKEIGENDKVFEDNNVKIAVEKKFFLFSRNNFRIFRRIERKRICF
jgi:iron-sulfur cluster assembly protein